MNDGLHGLRRNIVRATDIPLGSAGEPYVISSQEGEIIYVPFSKSLTRLLVTGRESRNAFSLIARTGSSSEPSGFYSHRAVHDVFVCVKGSMRVWVGDECRAMGVGDFVSVPPNTIQQYQILGDHSEMINLSLPGGCTEDFFRAIGEQAPGPFWPLSDPRDPVEVLGYKVRNAVEHYHVDVHHDRIGSPVIGSQWISSDRYLPGSPRPYFLQNAMGPAHLLGGTVIRPLITTREARPEHHFAMASIEGSSRHHRDHGEYANQDYGDGYVFAKGTRLCFTHAQHAFLVLEGVVEFVLGSCLPALLPVGQVIYIPAQTEFAFQFCSRFAKLYAIATNGAGIVGLSCRAGEAYDAPIPPNRPGKIDWRRVEGLQGELGFRICVESLDF